MTFDEYQKESQKTARYPVVGAPFIYPTLGLVGEAGEVAEKIKKIMRDNGGVVDDARKTEVMKEMGDVLWYLAQLAVTLDMSLEDIAIHNLEKLKSRLDRNLVHGDGDNR